MSSALLPANRTALEAGIADAIEAALSIGVPFRDLWSPERCPAAFLPYLAWAFSVDSWSDEWAVEVKRAAIRQSLAVHRTKGSRGSIRRALDAAGFPEATIAEGVDAERYGTFTFGDGTDYGGDAPWAEYRAYLTRPISNAQAAEVRAILDLIAPARCELAELNFQEASLLYGGGEVYGTHNYGIA